MRVIAKRSVDAWASKFSSARDELRAFHRRAEAADWKTFADVRADLPSVDLVGDRLVFNIKGNSYRLIGMMKFGKPFFYYRWFGTHAEYDKLCRKGQVETI